MTKEQRKSAYELVTERVATAMENGDAPWRKPWVGRRHSNLVSKQPYRGVNQWLTMLSPYASPWWVTFQQAKNLGGSVRKGEKGTMVVYFKVLQKDKKQPDGTTTNERIPPA